MRRKTCFKKIPYKYKHSLFYSDMAVVWIDWEGMESGGEVFSPGSNVEMSHGKQCHKTSPSYFSQVLQTFINKPS